MSRTDGAEGSERRSDSAARLSGPFAIAAAGPTLFAPFAATLLTLNGAPAALAAITALSAAPLAAVAAAAAGGSASGGAVALATVPIALGAAWTAWITGGAASPALAWMFAAAVGVGLFAGRRGPFYAVLLSAALAAFLVAAPEPSVSYAPFRSIEERELIAMMSWGAAMASVAAALWAALGAWREALPPLRHPTILARQALGRLSEDAAACALRIGREGRILQAVGAVERALDMPREQIKEQPLKDILHPDDAEATAERLAAAQGAPDSKSAAAAFDPVTLRVRSRLGGYRWVEAHFADGAGFPAPPGAEESGQTVLVLRERWRPLQEDFGPADPSRSAFLAQMSASLKDELTEVVGYAEIMKAELFGPLGGDRYREYARLAHDSGARLLERLEELLDLASLEGGARLASEELADATPLIDGAVRVARGKAETAGVSVKADIAADAPHVRIDRRALRRVLVAALLDAVRRTPIGDGVRLKVEAEDDAMRFAIYAEPRAGEEDGDGLARSGRAADAPGGDASEDGAARFGRLVAETLVERLGGVIAFHDGAEVGAGAPLCDVMLPANPPSAALESAESRPQPIPQLRPRPPQPEAPAAVAAASVPRPDTPSRSAGRALMKALPSLSAARKAADAPATPPPTKTPALVAAPRYDTDDEPDEGPLSAERQTEMAMKFEQDLKRERSEAAAAPAAPAADATASSDRTGAEAVAPEAPSAGAEDDVDLPLFDPKPKRRAEQSGD